jgi:predicted O-methyltransferase YrrM
LSGTVLRANKADQSGQAIIEFNDFIATDDRVDRVLLTLRDGVFMLRKR